MDDNNHKEIVAVKAVLGCECKRFGISPTNTFRDFVSTLTSLFASEITSIQYKDGDDDLISMGSEEELSVALRSVPSTGDILRLVLNDSEPTVIDVNTGTSSTVKGRDTLIEEANRRSTEMLNSLECEKQEAMEINCASASADTKDSKCASGEKRRNSIRHKIESASKLSEDINIVSSEVTGCIPVLVESSVSGLDRNFTAQKPAARKVRRISSGTTSGSTEKNDKKQGGGRGRQTQRKKKRKHKDSSSSSTGSSSSRSSSSSSSSSSSCSGSSCGENSYHFIKKSKQKKKKKKRKYEENMEKIFHKCEKHITSKVTKGMDKYTKKFKEEIVSSVTSSILQKLDGAVLHSFVVPNGAAPQSSDASGTCTPPKVAEPVPTKRVRYQHQNVVCDHCESEIFGPRYKCGNCSDYDLCENCEAIEGLHTPSHVFVKMHYPAALAGRRSVGGKSRPLLRANIYEEREKEREMEDLLQRKLDSGSELNQKVMEKFEKRRTKMEEVEQAKEACDARKEEWKKMKKEIKKNKKELAKKIKQQGKMMQRNVNKRSAAAAATHKDEGFCFDEFVPKVEVKIANVEPLVKTRTPDDKLSTALSSLQIINPVASSSDQGNILDTNASDGNDIMIGDTSDGNDIMTGDISDGNASATTDAMIDLTTDSDDVVVVHRDPLSFEISAAYHVPEILKKPDLVDFDREVSASASASASEDYVVVPNFFDLTVPIDNRHIHEHRNCESCTHTLPSGLSEPEPCASSSNELPMDLVASVPVTSRNQPDIASVSMVNIMDQSIEALSSTSSSPPISPEPLASKLSDEIAGDANLTQAPEVLQMCITSQPVGITNENIIINEPVPVSTESILIQPEPTIEVEPKPITELPSVNKNSISQDVVSAANAVIQQGSVDLTNPIVQSQMAQEQCILNTLSMNSFEEARREICNLREDAIEDEQTPLNPSADTSNSSCAATASVTRTNSDAGGISGALVGAMATIVDTVAHVVQSAKGSPPPRAQYQNGGVEVTLPVDPRVDGMQKLLDMGFFDRQVNERLLTKYNNDVGRCVGDLITGTNSQSLQMRH